MIPNIDNIIILYLYVILFSRYHVIIIRTPILQYLYDDGRSKTFTTVARRPVAPPVGTATSVTPR